MFQHSQYGKIFLTVELFNIEFHTFPNNRIIERSVLMKSMAKLLTIAVLLFAFTTCTSADTVWTLNNLQFNRPGFGINSATGSLTVSTALTIISWDIQVSGTNAQADYHYTSSPPVGGASLSADQLFVQFFDFSVNPNVFLD